MTLGGQVSAGFSLSSTVTFCWQLATTPAPVVAVQVTMVVPTGKAAGALWVTFVSGQPPPTVGSPSATAVALQTVGLALTVMSGGQVSVGVQRPVNTIGGEMAVTAPPEQPSAPVAVPALVVVAETMIERRSPRHRHSAGMFPITP